MIPTSKTLTAMVGFLIFSAMNARGEAPNFAKHKSRQEYAAAFAKIKEGMSAADVYRILGRPDDVRTKLEPEAIRTTAAEVWGYGVRKHLGFAVYGQVAFYENGRVRWVFGGEGNPPSRREIDEQKLQTLLRLIDTAPALGSSYDARKVIPIVNALHALGKEKSLLVIREYLRVASSFADARKGLYAVLFSLFEVPKKPGHMRKVMEGKPWPLGPSAKKRRLVPRFPICLEGDVPLLLITGYALAGEGEGVEPHVEYLHKHGTFRQRPLEPTDKPLDLLKKIMDKKWYPTTDTDRVEILRGLIESQLLDLTESVYPLPHAASPKDDRENRLSWRRFVEKYQNITIRWDASQGDYVRVSDRKRK